MALSPEFGADFLPLAERFYPIAVILTVCVLIVVRLWFDVLLVRAVTAGGDTEPPESKLNCSTCGARNSGSRTRCKTCDEPLPTE